MEPTSVHKIHQRPRANKERDSQAGKGKKPKGGAGKDKKTKGGKGKKGSKKGAKKEVIKVNLFTPAAMLNAYYISHNAAAFLEFRGYPWPGSLKKKKGKKKK